MAIVGNSIAGNVLLGLSSADGQIRNLDITPSFIGADLSFEHDRAEEDGYYFALYINGELRKLLPSTQPLALDVLDDGVNRLDILIIRPQTNVIPTLVGYEYGNRSYVYWDASTSEDCVAYEVYQSDGGDFSLVATVDRLDIHQRIAVAPDSGTGTGRVSIDGAWTGEPTNQLASVEVQVSGGTSAFRTNLGGSWSVWREFDQGGSYTLDSGARIVFLDSLNLYQDGDSWTFRVGPFTRWLSGALEDGTYAYKARAIDAAGNASDYNTAGSHVVLAEPSGVSNLAGEWNGSTISLGWTLPSDNDLAAVYVYSNYNNATKRLEDYIIEDGPAFVLASDSTSLDITPQSLLAFQGGYGYGGGSGIDYFDVFDFVGSEYGYGEPAFESSYPSVYSYGYGYEQFPYGEWKFYVRTVGTQGIINQSAELLSINTEDMISTVELSEPENISLAPLPNGGAQVTWSYNWITGPDATEFLIYYGSSEVGIGYSLDLKLPYSEVSILESDAYETYTMDFDIDLTANGPEAFFCVRSSNGSTESVNRNIFSVDLDNQAPELSGDTEAFSS